MYSFPAAGCGTPTCDPDWIGQGDNFVGTLLAGPIVANGVVYVGKNAEEVLAYGASGCGNSFCSPLWSTLTQDTIVSSSPAMVNGTLYIGTNNKFDGTFPGRLSVYTLNGH